MRIPARIKIALLALVVAAFCAVLLLAVLPTAIANSREARRFLEGRLAAETGARVSFGALRVRLLPGPCAALADLRLSWPQGATLEAPRLEFCLDPFALLRGRVALEEIALEAPAIQAALPAVSPSSPGLPDLSVFPGLAERLARSLPAARVTVRGGRLLLEEGGGRAFLLRDLALAVEGGGREGLSWSATGAAEGLEFFSFAGRHEGSPGTTRANLSTRGVDPARLQEFLHPGGPLRIAAGTIEAFEAEALFGPGDTSAITLTAGSAELLLETGGRRTALAIERLEARLGREGLRTHLSVPGLSFRNPAAALTLDAVVDDRATPRIQVTIAGRAGVERAREAALGLLGDFEDVRLLFEVLRAGNAPEVEVRLTGDTWSDLDRLDRLFLRGRLAGGRIRLPWVDLDLEEVNGEARIERGILHGRALSARTLGASGSEGSLDVGLSSANPLLSLDIAIEAELSPLPGLLARLVRIPAFREQMALVRDFSGTARGRLQLSGTHADVDVTVSARDLDLRGRYLPLPGPIAVRGGSFALEGRRVQAAGVEAEIGDSRLRGLGFGCLVGAGGETRLTAAADEAEIDLAQAADLLARLRPAGGLAVGRGRLSLRQARFEGDPLAAATWRLSAAGDLRGLSLEAAPLPGPLEVDQARLEFRGAGLAFRSPAVGLSRSRVTNLAGAFRWAQEPGLELAAERLHLDARDLVPLIAAAAPAAAGLFPADAAGTLRARDLEARIPLFRQDAGGLFLRAAIEEAAVGSALPGGRLALRSGEVSAAGGGLSLSGEAVSFGGATAREAVLEYAPGRRFHLAAPEVRIEAAEFLAALRRLPPAAAWLSEIESAGGALRLSPAEIDLPLDGSASAHLAFEAAPEDFSLAGPFLGAPLRLAGGHLRAGSREGPPAGLRLALAGIEAGLGPNAARVDGEIEAEGKAIRLSLDLTAGRLDLVRLAKDLEPLAGRRGAEPLEPTGRIGIAAERAVLGELEIAPLRMSLEPGGREGGVVWIERGALCGMLFMGRVGFAGGAIDAYLVPVVDARPLEETVPCLTRESSIASGNFNLDGALQARGRGEDLLRSATGRFAFVAEDGTIRKSPFFARLFTVLNLTELYRGSLPDFDSGGFDYRRSTAELELAGGKLYVREWTIDGPTLWMGGRGEIDLLQRTLDFTLMVSPFKTIDRIVNRIPGLGWILGGRLVAVPMKATGELKDPRIVPLSPEAVGTSLLEMLKRAILLPVRIIQPFIPGMEEIESGTIAR
ncbi:MAG: AsmA-like C-terminal domain-containing protein [Desulfobacterales bacterium]